MKKIMYGFGACALALLMSGLPMVASAEDRGEKSPESSSGAVEQRQVNNEQNRQGDRVESRDANQREDMRSEDSNGPEDQELNLDLEDDDSPAVSVDDLKQKIEVRKHELDQEEASSSPKHQEIVANANEVRLAVHSLLASKELLGGIGSQVSKIAKEMNDSVATTTNAEAKIQSRSILARLFFGGDMTSADILAHEAEQNQKRIAGLTDLLNQVNISPDVQTVLKEQIAALETAQTHLQDLAQKEKSAWGLFSWRF